MSFLKYFLSALFLVVIYSSSSSAQAPSQADIDKQYLEMVERAATMPADYDFAAVRTLYPKTSFFNPYGTFYKTQVHELFAAVKEGKPGAQEQLVAYLNHNFPLPGVHSRFAGNYKHLGRADLEKFHSWAFNGFATALFQSGTSVDAANAVTVLNIAEEYFIAEKYIKDRPEQSLKNVNGRVYDVLSGPAKENGEPLSMWFDITDIWAKNPAHEARKAATP